MGIVTANHRFHRTQPPSSAVGWVEERNPATTLSPWEKLGLPTQLTALRLGCINHALLSAEAIRADGVDLAGWVANQIVADYTPVEATLDTLTARLRAPMLAYIPWLEGQDVQVIASCLWPGVVKQLVEFNISG